MADSVGKLNVEKADETKYSVGLAGMMKDITAKKERYNPSNSASLIKVLEVGMFKYLTALTSGATSFNVIVIESSMYELESLIIRKGTVSVEWKLMFATDVLFRDMSHASPTKIDDSMFQCSAKIMQYDLHQLKGKTNNNNSLVSQDGGDEMLSAYLVYCLYNGARFVTWDNESRAKEMFPTLLGIEKLGDLSEER